MKTSPSPTFTSSRLRVRLFLAFALFAFFAVKLFGSPGPGTFYQYNGATTATLSGDNTVTLTRLGSASTVFVALGSGTGPYVASLILSDSNIHAGDIYRIAVSYPASSNPVLRVFDSGTGGALLHSSTGTAIAGNALLEFVNVTGTSWSYYPKGDLSTRNLGTGVQTALGQGANSSAGFVTGSGMASGTAGYVAVGSSNSYIDGIPALGSKNVLYATQWGAVPDSVIVPTGSNGAGLHVGTDNTVILDRIYQWAASHPGTTVVWDGAFAVSGTLVSTSHPAALMVPPFTDTVGLNKSCGIILSNSSNCVMISNLDITGNPAAAFDQDISFENLTLNGNCGVQTSSTVPIGTCANQGQTELSGTNNLWIYGVWFSGVKDLQMKNVDVRDSRTYAYLIGNYSGVTLDHCGAIWDWPYTPGTSYYEHQDGYHVFAPGVGLKILHCFASGGDDDCIALNTSEGVQNYGQCMGQGSFAYQRLPWPTTSNPAVTGTFTTSDTIIEDFKTNNSNSYRWYGYPGWNPGVIDGLKMIGFSGTAQNYANVSSVVGYNGLITGWELKTLYSDIAGSNPIETGTAFSIVASANQLQMFGNATSAVDGYGNAPFIDRQYNGTGNLLTWNYDWSFAGASFGGGEEIGLNTQNGEAELDLFGQSNGTTNAARIGFGYGNNAFAGSASYYLSYSGTTGIYGDLNLQSVGGTNPTWAWDPSGAVIGLSGTMRGASLTITGTGAASTTTSGSSSLAIRDEAANQVDLILSRGTAYADISVTGSGTPSVTGFPGYILANQAYIWGDSAANVGVGPGGTQSSGGICTAVGFAHATGYESTALGQGAYASTTCALAVGQATAEGGNDAIAVGQNAVANGLCAMAFGVTTNASYQFSTAIGNGAITTASNQIMLGGTGNGTSTYPTVVIPGTLALSGTASAPASTTTPAYWVAGTLISGTNTYTGRFPFYQ